MRLQLNWSHILPSAPVSNLSDISCPSAIMDQSKCAGMQKEEAASETGLVDLAVRALEMLAQVGASPGAAPEEGEPELGWGLASGEMPHVQACVLYILRVGVIEQLGEQGQVRTVRPDSQERVCDGADISSGA